MRIGLIAPPFISVPPQKYGGTELFVANLACGLHALGHDVIVYANGESRLPCEVRWVYDTSEWPLRTNAPMSLKTLHHLSWSIADASVECDVIHFNDAAGVFFTRFVDVPAVCTIHHPHEPQNSAIYADHPQVTYVGISAAQLSREPLARASVIYHGIDLSSYALVEAKRDYLAFLGRFAPCKGAHHAIEVARRTGMPLKLAGEIQPIFQDYWDTQIAPCVDGSLIEYVGEADLRAKNELLGHARALLFPIEWEEPFGLAMIEAMACGTPVLALPGGSVREIIREGVSGHVCHTVEDLAERAQTVAIDPVKCRRYVEERFSRQRMASDYLSLYRQLCSRVREAEVTDGAEEATAWMK